MKEKKKEKKTRKQGKKRKRKKEEKRKRKKEKFYMIEIIHSTVKGKKYSWYIKRI